MELIPWSQRQLEFGRPLDELPVLLERIRGTSARLSALIAHAPMEHLQLQLNGKWSVMEHLGHLITLQDRFDGRAEDFERERDRLCEISLHDQEPILQAHRRRTVGDALEEFRLKREAFAHRVARFKDDVLNHTSFHPCQNKRMRPMDMLFWIAEHDDHHLATIRRHLSAVGKPPRPAF